MCVRNAISEHIIKLRALVFECICERTTKFHEKILFDSRVINVQILMTKYLCFQYGINYCSHLSGSDVMLTQSTVSVNNKHGIFRGRSCFNESAEAGEMVRCKQSWPEPGKLPDLWAAAGACVSQPQSWRWPAEVTPDWRVGTFPPGVHRWNDQAVPLTSSSLHSSTRRAFWTQTLVVFDIWTDEHFDSHMSLWLFIVDTFVLGWPH